MWRRVVLQVCFSILDETLLVYQSTRRHTPKSKVFMTIYGVFLTLVGLMFVRSVGWMCGLYVGWLLAWMSRYFDIDVCVTVHHQYNDVNNQQDATTFSFMNLFKSALHVSGDKFVHPQEHMRNMLGWFKKINKRKICCIFLVVYMFWYICS